MRCGRGRVGRGETATLPDSARRLLDDPTGSLIHELSRKYTGQDYSGGVEGRVIVRVSAEHVYSQ